MKPGPSARQARFPLRRVVRLLEERIAKSISSADSLEGDLYVDKTILHKNNKDVNLTKKGPPFNPASSIWNYSAMGALRNGRKGGPKTGRRRDALCQNWGRKRGHPVCLETPFSSVLGKRFAQ